MSWHNKVVWSEGMFLRSQHFQQLDRYIQNLVEERSRALRPYGWGISELTIDESSLAQGKYGVIRCRGILSDGTPFKIPDDEGSPLALDIPEGTTNTTIFLSLPLQREGGVEADKEDQAGSLARFIPQEYEVRDTSARTGRSAKIEKIEVAKLRLRLVLEGDERSALTCLGIARVRRRTGDSVELDTGFIPPSLDCQATSRLAGFVKEVRGLLHERCEALAPIVTEGGRRANFLLLQVINRFEPLFAHFCAMQGLHPEEFYRVALQLAGELSTLLTESRRPIDFGQYRHNDLQVTFDPLMAELRSLFATRIEEIATEILLMPEDKYGFRTARITDEVRSLLAHATFVLVARADVESETLRMRLPTQVTIGPSERITHLVRAQVSGIRLDPLPHEPREIPSRPGAIYFELDRTADEWKRLEDSGGFAFHVRGHFPGLKLTFWAIRE